MRSGELVRKLRRLGAHFDEEGARHEVWRHEATGGRAAVPRHRSGEIPTGTLRSIVRSLGIDWQEFLNA